MFTMHLTKLQNVFLRQFKRISINATNFNVLSNTLSHTVYNNYSTSCTNVTQDLIFLNQQLSLNNIIIRQYGSRVQNNFHYVSYPQMIFHVISHNDKEKRIGCKNYYSSQHYNSIRHFSSVNVDSIAESQVPMQFSGIFRTLSESALVKFTQDSLLWMHDYTGLPWWSVIVLTTIMTRTAITLPLSLYQQYIFAKLENLKSEMDEIVKEMKIETNYGIHKYNWSKEYARRLYNHSMKKQWNKLIVRENCHPAKASILVLVQIPLWISLSMSIRNLCYILPKQDADAYTTYQEFTTDGFLWITNLTIADPFVLPIALGLFNLAIIEINYMNRVKELTKLKQYLTYFFRIAAIVMIPIAMYVPSCLSLYWATSSAFGLFQNLVLLSLKLRRFARVPVTTSESPHPYRLLRERIISRCRFGRKEKFSPKT
ncbi:cytochrome c oxidase assembly protein COX18, mitochondrial [Formica exsecta]|uniref:cytochrome c oxidase assembly protein COX18, mitochondrial n=1 Tax=Formica exsecta TaxID=72781 RepID=UPI001142D279|nr:cytochrome c oxidase assembly protein COX18, mitochondrial [Formica exsecta]